MAETYYLAVDIGASSGRHILGHTENGKIVLEEIYRFENGLVKKNGHLCWDTDRLFSEILAGMKRCKELQKIPLTMGIDTWGVDFVLLDGEGKPLGDAVAYRDPRTEGMQSPHRRSLRKSFTPAPGSRSRSSTPFTSSWRFRRKLPTALPRRSGC